MCNKEELKEILQRVRQFSLENFGDKLKSVILYGSYARGDFDDESDIDIMILVDMDTETLRQYDDVYADFASNVSIQYGVLLIPLVSSRTVFDHWKNDHAFYRNVAAEGIYVNG